MKCPKKKKEEKKKKRYKDRHTFSLILCKQYWHFFECLIIGSCDSSVYTCASPYSENPTMTNDTTWYIKDPYAMTTAPSDWAWWSVL